MPLPSVTNRLETIGRLAAGITHEINTPIHYLDNNLAFLKTAFSDLLHLQGQYRNVLNQIREGKSPAPETLTTLAAEETRVDPEYLETEIQRTLDQSLEGIDRVAKIVLALKDFAHPSLHEFSLTDLNHSILTTTTISRHEWKKVADLVLDLSPNLPLVHCARDEIHQVLLNLLVNATEAIREKIGNGGFQRGCIRITSQALEDSVEIRIADDGPGIPPEHRDRLFQPFFTTKAAGKGTGQGLALARQIIVERHQGTISEESSSKPGACFLIHLPLRPPGNPAGDAHSS